MGGFEGAPGWWIGGLVFIGIIIVCVVVLMIAVEGPAKKQKALELQNKAKKDYKLKQTVSSQDSKVAQVALNCRFCGAPIQAGEKLCNFCGQSWIWK